MGCFWSNEAEERDRYTSYQRRVDTTSYGIQLRARYGQYRCHCGRRWDSRRSWKNKYQICKRCRRHVYAYSQRELRQSDMTHMKSTGDHQKEYCQMCLELGYYCGKYNV